MKARTILLTLALCFVGTTVCMAQSPFLGTWKLNEGKSKYGPGAAKYSTVIYEAAGDSIKLTVDGVDGAGNPSHWEWTGKFDGKPYPISGNPNADMSTYRLINSRTAALTQTKGGKVVVRGRIVVSPDGKSRTVTARQTGEKGMMVHSVAVYDKQ